MSSSRSDSKNLALALLAMTQFVVAIDASIVNIALPSIGRALRFSQDDLTWVVNAYTLTFGGFLLLGGRLADLMGRRQDVHAGTRRVLAGLTGGGPGPVRGVADRGARRTGHGRSNLSPAALSIITTTFAEGSERNRALGVWGAVAGAGGAAGVLLGGVLTSGLSWRWVLFVNVPIGVICALLAPRVLQESHADADTRSFDIPGAIAVTAGLALPRTARRRRQRRLGLDGNAARDRRGAGAAGGLPGDRGALARSADAVLDLPPAQLRGANTVAC